MSRYVFRKSALILSQRAACFFAAAPGKMRAYRLRSGSVAKYRHAATSTTAAPAEVFK